MSWLGVVIHYSAFCCATTPSPLDFPLQTDDEVAALVFTAETEEREREVTRKAMAAQALLVRASLQHPRTCEHENAD